MDQLKEAKVATKVNVVKSRNIMKSLLHHDMCKTDLASGKFLNMPVPCNRKICLCSGQHIQFRKLLLFHQNEFEQFSL